MVNGKKMTGRQMLRIAKLMARNAMRCQPDDQPCIRHRKAIAEMLSQCTGDAECIRKALLGDSADQRNV